ncbi:hypothetical protein QEM35_000583 [Pseudomonas putida]|nr:hypothetical protein [Pseudomonas putida]EKT4511535.1 hypothetical protein [Pseudomonas putida]
MNALVKTPILCRDDLSFTERDDCGWMVNWPRNNPGVGADWERGNAFFDSEIAELSANDEREAFLAIQFAITSMGGHYTCLEIGFAESIARAAILGLRAIRSGAERFEPKDPEEV